MTQTQMFYHAHKQSAGCDEVFLEMLKGPNPITKAELKRNIKKRPALWKRYERWLDKLA